MKRSSFCLALFLGIFAVPASAQATAAEAVKPATRVEPAKKAPPKDAKKAPAPKEANKAPAPKEAKTPAPPPSKTQVSKSVTVYTNSPPPALKDKQGKDIPVTPDAYDVSSALPKKK